MVCCIVGLVILTVVGRLRRLVGLGRVETPILFAPVAHRPAPGEASVPVVAAEPVAGHRPATADVLRYVAVGVGLCLIAGPVLVLSGAVENTGASGMWLLRSLCYLTVIAAAFALSRSITFVRAPRGAGTLLVVVGAVIFELGVMDMHVFGLFEMGHDNIMGDFVFHNAGPALAVLGGLVLAYGSSGRRATSRRSSRSTATLARPSSSAVMVASTPPITS